MDDTPPVLEVLGMMRDNIDEVCNMMERLQHLIEDETADLTPHLEDLDPTELESTFSRLSSKRTIALATAFTLLADLVPESKSEAERQAAVFKKSISTFYAVRKHLHTALDGVV